MEIKEIIASIPWESFAFGIVGLAAFLYSIFGPSNNKLKKSGIQAKGIIFTLEQSKSTNTFRSFVKDKIKVRFLTKENVWITDYPISTLLLAYTGQYKEGDPVIVIYDPDNPNQFILKTKQSENIARLIIGVVGLIFLIIAVYKYFEGRDQS